MKYVKLNFGPFIKYREVDGEKIIRHFRYFQESDTFDLGFCGRESWACPVHPNPEKKEITKEEFETIWKKAEKYLQKEQENKKHFKIKD